MIKCIGIPYDQNSSFLKGPAYAPERIRLMEREGSANIYAENGLAVEKGVVYEDEGDIVFDSLNPADAFQTIRGRIAALLAGGDKVLSIGGDHSVSWPVVDAFTDRYPGLHVLHIDAHGDLYENFDNNPYSHASPFARIMEAGKVASLTQVGIRTLSTHQREQARRYGVRIVEMNRFNFDFIADLKGPLYISFDMDALDPAFAPGVSHHEPGGMSTRDALRIIQSVEAPIVGADLVEYNPMRDINHVTAMTGYKLMKELIARMYE